VETQRLASTIPRVGAAAASGGGAELARLGASRRHATGETAARHGTGGPGGEDHDTTEPRA
jgi:hypothetical protein